MRYVVSVVSCGLWLSAGALGWGSLVASYPSPAEDPDGVGYISTSYMCVSTNTADRVWRINRSNGSVVASFPAPNVGTAGCDFGTIGTTSYIWVASAYSDHIYRMGWNSGSIYSSFPSPGAYPWGIAFRDAGATDYLYHTDRNTHYLYRMNAANGSIYGSSYLSFEPFDLAWDPDHTCLWIAGVPSVFPYIFQTTTTGSILASFRGPSNSLAYGLAYDPVSDRVWAGIGGSVNRLNVYEIGGVGVTPASLGRVKALLR